MIVLAPISVGELFDKITILQLKTERMRANSAAYAIHELTLLNKVAIKNALMGNEYAEYIRGLKQINSKLWEVEDRKRFLIAHNELGTEFVELAKSVCLNNDMRAGIKKRINIAASSEIHEVKSFVLP